MTAASRRMRAASASFEIFAASRPAPLRPAERRARSSKVMIVSVLALNALIFGGQCIRYLIQSGSW